MRSAPLCNVAVAVAVATLIFACPSHAITGQEARDTIRKALDQNRAALPNAVGVDAILIAEELAEACGLQQALSEHDNACDPSLTGERFGGDRLVYGYESTVADTAAIHRLLAHDLFDFYTAKAAATGAPQVSQLAEEAMIRFSALSALQNEKLIEQNAEIIRLLHEIASKPSVRTTH